MCVCVYIYIYIHTQHTHKYIYTYVYIHLQMYTCRHTYRHTDIQTYIHTRHTYTHTSYTYLHTCIHPQHAHMHAYIQPGGCICGSIIDRDASTLPRFRSPTLPGKYLRDQMEMAGLERAGENGYSVTAGALLRLDHVLVVWQ